MKHAESELSAPHLPSESVYPSRPEERSRWIVAQRPARLPADPFKPHGWFTEPEHAESGDAVPTPTLLLTNRECPWHCLMCDLWKTTLTESVPAGTIPTQIDFAFAQLGLTPDRARAERMQLKLYNGGSFFDPRAIPPADFAQIARRAEPYTRVIVECHPGFVTDACLRFRDSLESACLPGRQAPQLEVAIGLETAHPLVLEKLNKRMTLDQFSQAAAFLRQQAIAVRAFVLVKPPFLPDAEALLWAKRSIEFAFDSGASVVSLIPTRAGNGAMDRLQEEGTFAPPQLRTLELAQAWGISLRRGRVFADLWDLERFSTCPHCFPRRLERLQKMNLTQVLLPKVICHDGGMGCAPAADRLAYE